MHPVKVESAWGAVAALLLMQCFGAIVVNGVLYHLGPGNLPFKSGEAQSRAGRLALKIFLSFWGLGWIAAFFLFETAYLSLIERFFHDNGAEPLVRSLHFLSIVKIVLAIIFAQWLIRLHVRYPFPKPLGHRLTPFFLILLLLASLFLVTHEKPGGVETSGDDGGAIFGVCFGLAFFGIGCATELFYLFGLVGAGFAMLVLSTILLDKDSLSVGGGFLFTIVLVIVGIQVRRLTRPMALPPSQIFQMPLDSASALESVENQ